MGFGLNNFAGENAQGAVSLSVPFGMNSLRLQPHPKFRRLINEPAPARPCRKAFGLSNLAVCPRYPLPTLINDGPSLNQSSAMSRYE
jgi:hypothetical protein